MTTGAYTASMAAIAGLAKTVAVDYAAQGIRCNVLCPGCRYRLPEKFGIFPLKVEYRHTDANAAAIPGD